MSEFKMGDRVSIKPEATDGYKQPWRGRFERGRKGTVSHVISDGFQRGRVVVTWDHGKVKYPNEWTFATFPSDLQHVDATEAATAVIMQGVTG